MVRTVWGNANRSQHMEDTSESISIYIYIEREREANDYIIYIYIYIKGIACVADSSL